MSSTVVTLGEILIRLSPPASQKILQATALEVHIGGAEANVAAALSSFGMNARMVSRVPDNDLGRLAINRLRSFHVDTRFIVQGDERMGLYFLETGFGSRPSKVIYDRAGSAMCHPKPEEYDFEKIFEGANWFHTSGITPALSDEAAELALSALKYAKAKGITTSIDINYRQKLWDKDKARYWLSRLCRYVDVYIGNIGHAALLLDLDTSDPDNYGHVFHALEQRFGFKHIACTIRLPQNASVNDIGAIVYDGSETYKTAMRQILIRDRVGSGDAFSAGFIYGLLSGMTAAASADFGMGASALKHTIPGDLGYFTVADVEEFLKDDGSANLVR